MTGPALTIDPEFRDLIPPLTAAERLALRESIIATGGALDPIKTWRGVVLDGHNRYEICRELGLPFRAVRLTGIRSRKAAREWMLAHQAARRSLTRDQLLVLHLTREIDPPPHSTLTEVSRAAQIIAAGFADRVLAGDLTLRQAWNRTRPKPARTTDDDRIPVGHELAGVSTLTGPDGETRGEWRKTRVAGSDEPELDPREHGHLLKRVSQMKRGDGSTAVQWETWASDEAARERSTLAAWERHAALYAGIAQAVPTPALDEDAASYITLYNLGDPHIGMLAWEPETGNNFDLKIACRELLTAVRLLVDRAAPSREAVIANLGDFLHAQDENQKTPGHGHKLDVDGRHAKVEDAAYALMRSLIEAALAKHEIVHVVNIKGNHDPYEAPRIARWLRAVFENEPRVVIHDANSWIQYHRFGKNLFGWTHGHRAKHSELPQLMATDRAADWAECEHCYFHTGHIHHKSVDKEHPRVMVESHNTMAGRDAYHAARYRARQQLQAIRYHREFGEDGRVTVNLARVHAALKGREKG